MGAGTGVRRCGCGACAHDSAPRFNRPGRSAVDYRLGTHSSFLSHLLARLPKETIPDGPRRGTRPLAALSVRSPADPTIALLDAFAVVEDVLAFYQERIANEGFLRTATERRSVLELARAVGYELSPGVAAATVLAFTLEEAEGAPRRANVPKGTRVTSVPAQGKSPQTFETEDDLEARAEWNAMRPRLSTAQVLTKEATRIHLDGATTRVRPGDVVLVVPEADATPVPRRVVAVDADATEGRTTLTLEGPAPPSREPSPLPSAEGEIPAAPVPLTRANVETLVLDRRWPERDLRAFLAAARWPEDEFMEFAAPGPQPWPPAEGAALVVFRAQASPFGHNAPLWGSLPGSLRFGELVRTDATTQTYQQGPYRSSWDAGEGRSVTTDSQGNALAGAHLHLDGPDPGIVPGSWILLEGPAAIRSYSVLGVREETRSDYALSGKATGITLTGTTGLSTFRVRRTLAHVVSEALPLAESPILSALSRGDSEITLDRMVLGLDAGRAIVVSGELDDLPGVEAEEVRVLEDAVHAGGVTTLFLDEGLRNSYVRDTVRINANVARASHGETVSETLGSGDASVPHQRFTLRRAPLTHVAAPTPSGTASTLRVRVDGVEWKEAPSLHDLSPGSEGYVARMEDDGRVVLTFGDGVNGARLPTGRTNVAAAYRIGIGPDGEVAAGSLTNLAKRPLGVREVTNPLPATGAAPPESLERARENAPRTVLTLGRAISLRDFEDFARGFAGIGKAQAVALALDGEAFVHLTVASASGDRVLPDSALHENLVAALDSARDPAIEVRVDTFHPSSFSLRASVLVDPAREAAVVLAAARAAVREAFSFERRGFGEPVSPAEVVAALQRVPGVEAVDLDELALRDPGAEQSDRPRRLDAHRARVEDGTVTPADLLLVDPDGVLLTEMTPPEVRS